MADFSIGDALGSGFGLMGRRPLSVIAWGLVYILIGMVLPISLMVAMVGSDFVNLFTHMRLAAPHPGADPAGFNAMMQPFNGKIMLINPIMQLTTLVVQAVLTAAVFRATLEPRNRGLAYLGLAGREWWLMVLGFAARVLAVLLALAMALGGFAVGLGLNALFEAQHVDKTLRVAAYVVLGVVLLALFVGILVRFCMAGPMTFADRKFRLFESWKLTRRHGWKLFGLCLLLVIVSIVMVIVFEGLGAAAVFLIGGWVHWDGAAFMAALMDQHRLWTSGLGEGLVVLVLLCAYAFGGIFAVSVAPWAVVYRELLPKPAPVGGALWDAEPGVAPLVAPAADHGHHGDGHGGGHDHGHADPHGAGDDGHGHHGHDDHGHGSDPHASHGHDDHGHGGHDTHGHDDHGHDDHGHGGHEAHGHEAHGHDAHGHDDHGHDAHGHDDHGHDDHGHGHGGDGHGGGHHH